MPLEAEIFESKENHARFNKEGFWGPPQSSIDWCERNYVLSYYIAEWFNTWSNMVLIGLGIWGLLNAWKYKLEWRFILLYLGVASVGVGSTAFHGTLTYIGQQGDETPMMWTIFTYYYCYLCMDPEQEKAIPLRGPILALGFTVFLIIFTVVHYHYAFVVAFQGLFMAVTLVAIRKLYYELQRTSDRHARMIGYCYVPATVLGFFFWNLDNQLCPSLHELPLGLPNPQFHAWWHWLVGFACYFGPLFVSFRRLEVLGRKPKIVWIWGFLPTVKPMDMEDHSVADLKAPQLKKVS
jgi:dihydroceramidase